MSALDKFIEAADHLVEFYTAFQEIPIVDQTLSSLEASKLTINDLWADIKRCYSESLRTTEPSDQSDKDANKGKYRLSSNTYISCLSDIIEKSKKLQIIKSDEVSDTPQADYSDSLSCTSVAPCNTELFYGDYQTWPPFRDMFTALYINHPKLCSVQKLFHLHSRTRGDALKIVSKFSLTADSFELAWKALSNEYENKRRLVNNQLKKLFSLSTIPFESGKDIKNMQHDINDCLSILQAHQVSTDSWDPILVFMCSNRLPETTLSLWEQSVQNPRELPSWAEMNTFLTNRHRVLETVTDIKHSSKQKGHSFKSGQGSHTNKDKYQQHKALHSNVSNFSCKLCKGSHPIRRC